MTIQSPRRINRNPVLTNRDAPLRPRNHGNPFSYLSLATGALCRTLSARFEGEGGTAHFLCMDVDAQFPEDCPVPKACRISFRFAHRPPIRFGSRRDRSQTQKKRRPALSPDGVFTFICGCPEPVRPSPTGGMAFGERPSAGRNRPSGQALDGFSHPLPAGIRREIAPRRRCATPEYSATWWFFPDNCAGCIPFRFCPRCNNPA